MTVDQAIQDTIFKASNYQIEAISKNAKKHREAMILGYQAIYKWSREECEEYLGNVSMAYELLVKEAS